MELRGQSLWLAKRDTVGVFNLFLKKIGALTSVFQGKDEVFLCSLSNFDVYFVTRKYKFPKPFIFAVKSSDNLSLFENTADYVHVFSCSNKEGEQWIKNILLARVRERASFRRQILSRLYSAMSCIKNVTFCSPSKFREERRRKVSTRATSHVPRNLSFPSPSRLCPPRTPSFSLALFSQNA